MVVVRPRVDGRRRVQRSFVVFVSLAHARALWPVLFLGIFYFFFRGPVLFAAHVSRSRTNMHIITLCLYRFYHNRVTGIWSWPVLSTIMVHAIACREHVEKAVSIDGRSSDYYSIGQRDGYNWNLIVRRISSPLALLDVPATLFVPLRHFAPRRTCELIVPVIMTCQSSGGCVFTVDTTGRTRILPEFTLLVVTSCGYCFIATNPLFAGPDLRMW